MHGIALCADIASLVCRLAHRKGSRGTGNMQPIIDSCDNSPHVGDRQRWRQLSKQCGARAMFTAHRVAERIAFGQGGVMATDTGIPVMRRASQIASTVRRRMGGRL
jgi:hypothetical protein